MDDNDLVIQADAPDEYTTYMHRSGRTGRAEISAAMLPTQLGRDVDQILASV